VLSSQNLHQAADLAVGEFTKRQDEAIKAAKLVAQHEFSLAYARHMNRPKFPQINSAGEMLAYVIARANRMFIEKELESAVIIDGNCLHVYQQLASYFSGDYATFPSKLNPRKGILLFGGYGVGKSLVLRLFGNNPVQSYRLVSARSITESYRLNGDVCEYKHRLVNQCSTKFFGQTEIALCIDDLGAERTDSKTYGSGFSIGDLIQDRYDNPQLRGWTHAATNGTKEELRDAYGPRVLDRLKEMFNILEFPDQLSRRS
jgi:hypothetical protein